MLVEKLLAYGSLVALEECRLATADPAKQQEELAGGFTYCVNESSLELPCMIGALGDVNRALLLEKLRYGVGDDAVEIISNDFQACGVHVTRLQNLQLVLIGDVIEDRSDERIELCMKAVAAKG